MSKAPVQDSIRSFALEHLDAAYIMGATGETCTPAYRRARAAQYPEYQDKIISTCPVLSGRASSCDGCEDEDDPAFDCAQFTLHAAEAAGLYLPSGATSQWNKGDWIAKGTIAQLPRDHVCFVYRRKSGSSSVMAHTGIYLGDGMVADARGHADDIVHAPLDSFPWTHFAILRGMPCPEGLAAAAELPTLRQGSQGESVRELQRLLRTLGYELEIDGKFGPLTLRCVKSFQGSAGLARDGVVGVLTWAALQEAAASKGDPETDDDQQLPTDTDLGEIDPELLAEVDRAMAGLKAAVAAIVNAAQERREC